MPVSQKGKLTAAIGKGDKVRMKKTLIAVCCALLAAGCAGPRPVGTAEIVVTETGADEVPGLYAAITDKSFAQFDGDVIASGGGCGGEVFSFDLARMAKQAHEETMEEIFDAAEFHAGPPSTEKMFEWGIEGWIRTKVDSLTMTVACPGQASSGPCLASTDLSLHSEMRGHIGQRFDRVFQSVQTVEVADGEDCRGGSYALAQSLADAISDTLGQLAVALAQDPRVRSNRWAGAGQRDACGDPWAIEVGHFGGRMSGWLRWRDVIYEIDGYMDADGKVTRATARKPETNRNQVGPGTFRLDFVFKDDDAKGLYAIQRAGILTCSSPVPLKRV